MVYEDAADASDLEESQRAAKILIVDDDAEIIESVRYALEGGGYQSWSLETATRGWLWPSENRQT